ncbi:hypothetical protein BHM03_00028126, partial [Ensete ventricosum]
SGIGRNLGVRLGKSVAGVVERGSGGGSTGMHTQVEVSTLPVSGRSYDHWGIGLTCVKSVVRPLGIRPYLCQVGRTTIGAPILAFDQLPTLGRPHQQASCPKQR